MSLKSIEMWSSLPHTTNSAIATTDLILVDKQPGGSQALPISELDKRYAGNVGSATRVASGVAAVTGTATVATGLNTVVAVVATAQDDPDGTTLGMVSATIGNQTGSPAAGSVILKCWKTTATGNDTLIAATAAKNVNWVAYGT